ncbi:MAG: class A beta-lactamase [Arenimonas sp.]
MSNSRRSVLGALACLPALALPGTIAAANAATVRSFNPRALRRALDRLEARSGGRLGFALLDTGTGAQLERRGDERFPMCSTFKLMLVAATLQRIDRAQERPERRITITRAELVSYSPFTETRAGTEVELHELCNAAMTLSDNSAANALLKPLGGPAGVTAFARSLGDEVTRLDRNETELNSAIPGDPRDTTSPLAMLGNLRTLLLGTALSDASRRQLLDWMRDNTTGDSRLRAGLPKDWKVGDKTGSGGHGTTNDIAIAWPPGGAPWLVASYLTGSRLESAERDAVHASVARALSRT